MADIDWHTNTTRNGAVIMGDDVIMYGLFVEHYHQYNTLWMGDRGKMYFHQNETPYEVHYQRQYMSHGGKVRGWAQYKVDNRVNEHLAVGLGLYSVFVTHQYAIRETPIVIDNAIEVPNKPGVKVINACTTRFGNAVNSGLNSIVNGAGAPSLAAGTQRLLYYNNGTARITATGTPVTNIAQPADEIHWVESLVINKSGIVTANPHGGIPHEMFEGSW